MASKTDELGMSFYHTLKAHKEDNAGYITDLLLLACKEHGLKFVHLKETNGIKNVIEEIEV